MRHKATSRYWRLYTELPHAVQRQADKAFSLLKENPAHPSLHLKKVGLYWSARVSLTHRAVAIKDGEDFAWFWIGPHDEYDRLIKGS
jgi:hypothetical protein